VRLRELLVVASEKTVGAVGLADDGKPFYDGAAESVFAGMRVRRGDDATIASLLDDGWSNGYLYLAPEQS
jgi:hypothetical protein